MVFECMICEESLEAQPPQYQDSGIGKSGQYDTDKNNTIAILMTPCGHMFHEVCLTKWFQGKAERTCPACRQIFPLAVEMRRVFPTIAESTFKAGTPSPRLCQQDSPNQCPVCQDFKDINQTLMKDNAEISEKYVQAMDELEFAKTIALSYEEIVEKNSTQVLSLEKHGKETLATLALVFCLLAGQNQKKWPTLPDQLDPDEVKNDDQSRPITIKNDEVLENTKESESKEQPLPIPEPLSQNTSTMADAIQAIQNDMAQYSWSCSNGYTTSSEQSNRVKRPLEQNVNILTEDDGDKVSSEPEPQRPRLSQQTENSDDSSDEDFYRWI